MNQQQPASPTVQCLRTTICGFLLPFFLSAAGGNLEAARAAILELIDAYNARTLAELDLVGRIVGFSIVAMDNLRLSMTEDMSDTKVLRYRSNAVALSRAAEQHVRRSHSGNAPPPTAEGYRDNEARSPDHDGRVLKARRQLRDRDDPRPRRNGHLRRARSDRRGTKTLGRLDQAATPAI
jgi:hypothetical protein